jgi:hypothetical protein
MKPTAPMTKAEMIERSLRCFVFGLIGLLPVIGIPFAVLSVRQYLRVKYGTGEMWNPAHRYCFWGGVCARMGLSLFLLVPGVVIIIWHIGTTYYLF